MFDLHFFDVGSLGTYVFLYLSVQSTILYGDKLCNYYDTDSDLRMDFEGMTLQDANQNLSRKSSLRRSSSCSTRPSQCNRSHRKLCRQKAVYARPSIQSYRYLISLMQLDYNTAIQPTLVKRINQRGEIS